MFNYPTTLFNHEPCILDALCQILKSDKQEINGQTEAILVRLNFLLLTLTYLTLQFTNHIFGYSKHQYVLI